MRSAAEPNDSAGDLGLETLPDDVLEKVLRCAIHDGQGRELLIVLPVVCKKLLAALRRLKMPLGFFKAGNAEAVRQQANEPGRAWDLGMCLLQEGQVLFLSVFSVTDVSALAGCAALHTLDMSRCEGVEDVSALAGCTALHKLGISGCSRVEDVSALAGCAALHTLDMSRCSRVEDVSALAGCSTLCTLDVSMCGGVKDISALAGCVTLQIIGTNA